MHRKHRPWSRPWEYDSSSDRYELHDEQLANLAIGRDLNRALASRRRQTIGRLLAQGLSAADIVLVTGYSRAAVWRHIQVLRDPLLA